MKLSRAHLLTEQRLPQSMRLDRMSIDAAVQLMNRQNAQALRATASQRRPIVQAVQLVAGCLSRGGRLFYVGAGTSGRLGVLDASECPPTFRTQPCMVQGVIAGGRRAMFVAKKALRIPRGLALRRWTTAGWAAPM